jgi:hypothetical protein
MSGSLDNCDNSGEKYQLFQKEAATTWRFKFVSFVTAFQTRTLLAAQTLADRGASFQASLRRPTPTLSTAESPPSREYDLLSFD